MEEERKLREEEIRMQSINYKDKYEALLKKSQKTENLNNELMKDFMQLRFDSSNNEKRLYEEIEILKLQNEALSVSIKDVINKTNYEKDINKSDYDRKTKEIGGILRTQVKGQEENVNIIKEQYKQIQKIYNSKVKDLENKCKLLSDKLSVQDNKKNYEIEGYINEINLIRQRVKSYENYVYKLRKLTYGVYGEIDKTNEIANEIKNNGEEFLTETKGFKVNYMF